MVEQFRPFELVAPGSVEVSHEGGRSDDLTPSGYSPPAAFTAVEVTVRDAGDATVLAGLAASNGEHLLGFHDARTGETGLEIRTAGLSTVLAQHHVRGHVRRLAFVLCANQPTVLVDVGHGWRPAVTDRHRVGAHLDFRVPATLARFTSAWGSRGGTSDVGPVRAGLFGMAGLRDLHLVQHADGSPYTRDGRMFLTATCAGLGFFEQAHWGVFAFDPSAPAAGEPLTLEQTAHLFSLRDGMVLGDHAGQLVRDGGRWLVATSSWGDFTPHRGVHVRHTTTTDDLLAGVHVLETERTPLPTEVSSWDPGMTRIDGRWYVTYVESPSQQPFDFHPALAAGPAGTAEWTDRLDLVGAATDLHHCEGPVLARPDGPAGDWRVLASDGHARRYPAFDLAMRSVGEVDAPYGSNIPHPQVVDLTDGERVILTFDDTRFGPRVLGYGTHGDVVVMRATPPRS